LHSFFDILVGKLTDSCPGSHSQTFAFNRKEDGLAVMILGIKAKVVSAEFSPETRVRDRVFQGDEPRATGGNIRRDQGITEDRRNARFVLNPTIQ
jgi:hypothetical protein